eukprot:gene25473-33245_t
MCVDSWLGILHSEIFKKLLIGQLDCLIVKSISYLKFISSTSSNERPQQRQDRTKPTAVAVAIHPLETRRTPLLSDFFPPDVVVASIEEMLNLKQKFVRSISHAVEHCICIGLKLLLGEVEQPLTYLQMEIEKNLLLPLLLDESGEVKVDSADAEVQQSSKKALNLFKYLVQKIQAWFQLLKEIEQKTMTIEKEPLAAWDIVSSAVKPFNIQARERNLEIHTELEPHMTPSTGDAGGDEIPLVDSESSHQKELNELLLSNAMKFSNPGTQVKIKAIWCPKNLINQVVTVSFDDQSKRSLNVARGSLQVSVIDCGPVFYKDHHRNFSAGLTADNLKKLFGEGVQFNANKLQAGGGAVWGCGSPRRVHIHSGAAGVRRMQATLGGPLGPPPADTTIAPFFEPDVERPDLTITHWKPLSKILVVDDSAPSRKMLCRVMKSIGCACWEADDGVGCIRQNTSCVSNGEQNFDLVLMDFIMPMMMHGPETTVELRKAGFKGAVIGVTENVLQEDVDHFIQCGANAVLAKPQIERDFEGFELLCFERQYS